MDQLFRKTPPMFYNIIDADAAHQKITKFTQPTFLSSTSLGHIHSKSLPAAYRPNKESNFLLISQDGAVTMFHQDFSSTSVLYILLKGCKTFFLTAPTSINQDLFNQFLQQSRRKFFFGSHESLNMGGCQAITLKARQGLIMPANMIHMVETAFLSPMELTSFSRNIFVWPLIPSRQNAFRKQSSLNATLLSRSLRLLILCLEYSESFNIFENLTSC